MTRRRAAAGWATATCRRAVVVLVVAGTAVCSAGCSRPPQVVPADRADAPACQVAASRWPQTVTGRHRVAVQTSSPAVAAWGDPAIIARCGLTSPGPTTDECISVDGIDWIARRLGDGMQFVSYGRDPAIEVLVPAAYAPEPLVLGVFGAAARSIPQGERRCR